MVAAPDTGLVERDAELAAIAETVRRGSGVLLLEGEAGVGKTQLLKIMRGRTMCATARAQAWPVPDPRSPA